MRTMKNNNSSAWRCNQRISAGEFDSVIWIHQCGNHVAQNVFSEEV